MDKTRRGFLSQLFRAGIAAVAVPVILREVIVAQLPVVAEICYGWDVGTGYSSFITYLRHPDGMIQIIGEELLINGVAIG